MHRVAHMSANKEIKIKLSPLSRLYFTLHHEMVLGGALFSEPARYARFVKMCELAERKRDLLLRNMFLFDALVLLILFGKPITVPGLNITLADIPAGREVVTFLASLTFQFAAIAYVNWQGYAAILNVINTFNLQGTGVDSEFITAADKFSEFAVKLYRSKMNILGNDVAFPGRLYKLVAHAVTCLLLASVVSFLCLHLIVVFISGWETFTLMPGGLLLYAYLLFLCAANLGGFLVWTTLNRKFQFTINKANPPKIAGNALSNASTRATASTFEVVNHM